MTAAKITISLPEPTLAKAREAVRAGEAASLSSYIAQAVDQKRDHDDLLAMLAELALESGGPLSPSERAVARADLGLADARRPRKGHRAKVAR